MEQQGTPDYGRPHRSEREWWAPRVATGTVDCWRCRHRIRAGQAWQLGHRARLPSHPEHARCNQQAGGREGARRMWARRRAEQLGGSREW